MSDLEHHAAQREARRAAPYVGDSGRQSLMVRYLHAVASGAAKQDAEESRAAQTRRTARTAAAAQDGPGQRTAGVPPVPRVRDVMTDPVAQVAREATFTEVARLLSREGLGAAPVVGEDRRVLGVVAESDLLAEAASRTSARKPGPLPRMLRRRRGRRDTAGALMTAPAVSVHPDTPVAAAAVAAARSRIRQLPVTDHRGRLVGMVSRNALLRALVRDDAQLRDLVAATILAGRFGLAPGTVDVVVERGVVALHVRTGPSPAPDVLEAVRELDDVTDVVVLGGRTTG